MKACLCAIMAAVLFSAAYAADTGLYLYPRAERGDAPLTISDIAKVEAGPNTASPIGSIIIDEALYEDGYLDRSEIARSIGELADGRVTIYGSGVRVTRSAGVPVPAEGHQGIVKSGNPVRFLVVSSLIRVERMGTALRDGAAGDVIPVKLKGSTVLRGVIVNERTVELKL